ncbi:alpha/beta hydrolase [Sphingomonas sp. VNH70]|uniref:alpha/beta hydrolase n=1 Tax=Sphingomonas silueang TaxID=3156617 RepID=UPI0032B37F36
MAVIPPGPPPLGQFLVETPRAALALAGLPFQWRDALAGVPKGDGGPVLLLPGLFNSDRSMALMARYLRAIGHAPHGWGLGRNFGQRSIGREGAALLARIEGLAQASGRPVALVGVSMGGIMARFAAHRVPDVVEQVVTVAAPYAGPARATRVWRLYEWISGESVDDPAVVALAEEVRRPLPVPATAIWSASDGLVNGLCCRVEGEPGCRAIEVDSSHYGVQTRPAVWRAVAEALAANVPPAALRRRDG